MLRVCSLKINLFYPQDFDLRFDFFTGESGSDSDNVVAGFLGADDNRESNTASESSSTANY